MSHRLQLTLFFCAIICFTMALGIHESIFNNYLRDTFAMSAGSRGWLELPREMPGFLVVLMAGILCMLPVTHLGVVGALTFSAGLTGIMVAGARLWPMMAMMMVASAGQHLIQPTEASIALALSGDSSRGRRMGQLGMIGTLGTVLGTGVVWFTFNKGAPQYRVGFACAAGMAAVAGIVFTLMHIPHLHQPRPRLVVRRRYWLYYLLEALFGARKQIFITFGIWVLISVYGQPATGIAQLMMIASAIGIFFKPLAGAVIDRFGERTVMIADGLLLAIVCIGYGYAMRFAPNPAAALTVARVCFIADNLLFALGTSRAVYLSRVTKSPQDLTSTLALGVSINHLPSMTVPAVAGAVWEHFGYERVFLAAAVLALVISAVSTLVPRRQTAATDVPASE